MLPPRIDFIGDIHGQLGALRALGTRLGYDVAHGFTHPQGRTLVFLGDLVDRGPHSLETAELVAELVSTGRALCLMGNHEHNLVETDLGLSPPRSSNKATMADLAARASRWRPVLDFFRELPIALDLPELRVVHAAWHLPSFTAVQAALAPSGTRASSDSETVAWLRQHIVVGTPFVRDGYHAGIPYIHDTTSYNRPHEMLLKGFEEVATAGFADRDGHVRSNIRVTWWVGEHPEIPHDKTTVFGHYWNLPPVAEAPHFTPPHPSGHPDLRRWQAQHASRVSPAGSEVVPSAQRFVCVDYGGVLDGGGRPTVGAYRWPEHAVTWASE